MKKNFFIIGAILTFVFILQACRVIDETEQQEIPSSISSTPTSSSASGTASSSVPTSGPYTDQIYSASSTDGLTWTHDNFLLIDHASVPIALLLPSGTIRIYYLDAATQGSPISCSDSTDNGKTFSKMNCNIISHSPSLKVDPTIVILEDGRYRMYYFAGSLETGDPASAPGNHNINSAISDDGLTFTEEGTVFSYEGLADPDVFWNGKEFILTSAYVATSADGTINVGKSVVATSDDGTDFTFYRFFTQENVGLEKPLTLEDGTFRMYSFNQSTQKEIISFTSEDGLSWIQDEGIRLEAPIGKHMTGGQTIQLPDGTYKMFFMIKK